MASVTLTIPTAAVNRIKSALVGRSATPGEDMTPKEYLIGQLKELVHNHEREVAEIAAREAHNPNDFTIS